MIGRGAIRNPWLFEQIRQVGRAQAPEIPSGRQVLRYLYALMEATALPELREASHVQRVKKHLNFIALGVDASGDFLHRIRRATTAVELSRIFEDHRDHDRPMPLEPLAVPMSTRDVLAGEHC
jgi:tRNA-dihydrouridine synthase